jgi:hypothetical protein
VCSSKCIIFLLYVNPAVIDLESRCCSKEWFRDAIDAVVFATCCFGSERRVFHLQALSFELEQRIWKRIGFADLSDMSIIPLLPVTCPFVADDLEIAENSGAFQIHSFQTSRTQLLLAIFSPSTLPNFVMSSAVFLHERRNFSCPSLLVCQDSLCVPLRNTRNERRRHCHTVVAAMRQKRTPCFLLLIQVFYYWLTTRDSHSNRLDTGVVTNNVGGAWLTSTRGFLAYRLNQLSIAWLRKSH